MGKVIYPFRGSSMEVKTNIFRPTRGSISNVLIQFFSKITVYLRKSEIPEDDMPVV